jgi:hypothetical protein
MVLFTALEFPPALAPPARLLSLLYSDLRLGALFRLLLRVRGSFIVLTCIYCFDRFSPSSSSVVGLQQQCNYIFCDDYLSAPLSEKEWDCGVKLRNPLLFPLAKSVFASDSYRGIGSVTDSFSG